jgi:hypothetical protein
MRKTVTTTSESGSRPPTTTAEQDLRSAGQRNINKIWEYTQSYVAVIVVTTTALGIFVGRVFQGFEATQLFPAEWWTIVGLVIGFYFGRTNHSRIGDEPHTLNRTGNMDDR